ncbi:MAG: RpiB/LacA/LacB family sugar-phosphate isomerase [Patescibacteria group bacterium]
MIYIGSDHRGYNLKETLKVYLSAQGGPAAGWKDLGAFEYDPDDDYPDYALAVAQKVAEDSENNRGILICGSGVGVDVVANKIKGIRSALCFDTKQARASRNDDNTNILSLPADFISENLAKEITKVWLETPFSGSEHYTRRIEKIEKII